MPTTTHVFENGETESLSGNHTTSSFIPISRVDSFKTPSSRKRPKGPSMTNYVNRYNTYEAYDAFYEDVLFKDVSRTTHGWHYSRTCSGGSDTPSPYFFYANTAKKTGLMGAGGIGAQWVYLEAKRLKLNLRRPVNISNLPGVRHYPLVSKDGGVDVDILDIIGDLQRSVVADTLEAYDAGTEFAERTKTIQTILGILRSCVSPLRSLRKLLRTLEERPGTNLAELVLQYEYAIRPLLYSMEAINKIVKDRAKMTIRKARTKSITLSTDGSRQTSVPCTFEQGTVVYKVRVTSYLHFDDELDRVTSSIHFNPLLTAWELIPFSFVVDWFVGIGDWLVNQTASLSQSGANALFCVSVRKQGSCELVFVKEGYTITSQTFTKTYNDFWSNNTCFTQGGPAIPGAGNVSVERKVEFPKETVEELTAILSKETFNSYERTVFTPSDVPLEINNVFSLSKRRLLDTVSLLAVQLKR